MNWIDAAPVALVTVAWLLVPGLLVSYLLGLRGVAAWGLAPITGIALIASAAVLGGFLGVPWSFGFVLIVSVAVVAVVGVLAFLLRRAAFLASDPDPRRLTLLAALGLLPALVLGMITLIQAMGAPDTLSQTYDAVFHYNALAYIADSHNASSLSFSALGNPDVPGFFYPAAWHDVASLVMMSSGASIPLAANAVTVVATIVLWPLSCLLLVRQLFGRHTAALAITGTLSIGFTAFPWDLLGFGVLWPNLLGMSIGPALLALVITLTRWAKDDAIGQVRGWLALVAGLAAGGLAHPNVLFSVAVLSLPPIVARVAARSWRLRKAGHGARGLVEALLFVAFFSVAWWWAATTPMFAATRDQYWPPFETPANAVGDVALNATHRHDALWLLSIVVILGIVASRRWPVLRLLVAGHLITAFLYVLTASINRMDTQKFTGYWYNDAHRLAAMLPITGVPLAVGGILYLATKILEKVGTTERAPGWRRRWAGNRWLASLGALAVILTLLLGVGTRGLYPDDRYDRVVVSYVPKGPASVLLTPQMRQFYDKIAREIPKDAVVVGNPFEGSSLLWALENRKVLFPHFRNTTSEQQDLIAKHLDDLTHDPEVCEAVEDLHVKYLLIGGATFRTADTKWKYYAGLSDPFGLPGFELVDESGPSRLYKITGCDAASQPAG
ncbi:MAG TPA: DUF6541 family protein [Actinophytocola sp.]|jgi:hypothetical protein|uniref:DUF6541 family protein n=1 Tax=Actinophytocola sp. TaxID=1872138 RepID=UPI002F946795